MSIEESILISIKALPAGDLFLPADFSDLGSSEAVRISLFSVTSRIKIYYEIHC